MERRGYKEDYHGSGDEALFTIRCLFLLDEQYSTGECRRF
jgi:hypothetical protein